MKWCIAFLALLQSLDCSGYPMYNAEMAAIADRALGVALTNVNLMYAGSNLYRVTRGSITQIVPVGLNTADLLLKFGIKETECLKSSREDPQRCTFKSGFFVPSSVCSTRVRVSAELTQVMTLRCGRDSSSSSSSESSEEMFVRRRQQQFIPSLVDRNPSPPSVFNAPPPPRNPDRSFHREEAPVEVQPPPVNPGRSFPREEVVPVEVQPPPVNPGRSFPREVVVPVEVQPPPIYPGRSFPREEARPRGDTFSNYVE